MFFMVFLFCGTGPDCSETHFAAIDAQSGRIWIQNQPEMFWAYYSKDTLIKCIYINHFPDIWYAQRLLNEPIRIFRILNATIFYMKLFLLQKCQLLGINLALPMCVLSIFGPFYFSISRELFNRLAVNCEFCTKTSTSVRWIIRLSNSIQQFLRNGGI